MNELFIYLFNVSISAGFFVLAILLFRLIFKRAPKFVTVLLFGLVGLRLILPISIETNFSLVPSRETLPKDIETEQYPAIDSGIPAIDEIVNPAIGSSLTPSVGDSANPMQIVIGLSSYLWITVTALMILYLAVSFIRLRLKLHESVRLSENVYISDQAKTPFILGVIKPKIFIPSSTDEKYHRLIIAHERAHLKRGDHIWKPLAFLILSVYWFNPILWVAYYILCRDIELACDEKVTRNMEGSEKGEYSEAMLACSNTMHVGACPLAFGEVGVKTRIERIAEYVKPTTVIIILSVAVSIILAGCFLTYKKDADRKIVGGIYYAYGSVYSDSTRSIPCDDVPLFIFFDDGRIMVESRDLDKGTFRELREVHKCYLSKKDYLKLFDGEYDTDHIRKYTVAAYRITTPRDCDEIDCDEIYLFTTRLDEIYVGYSYGGEKISDLFLMRMNETLPTNYMIATYTEVGAESEIYKSTVAINPIDSSMSITFGALSSYIATGKYEIVGSRLVFNTDDSFKHRFVFDVSGDNMVFIGSESSAFEAFADGTEFKRTYQIYPIPASTFYDIGGDGRYELVHVTKSEVNGEFALRFNIYAKGDAFPTITVPFERYDYINLVRNDDGELILVCSNKEIITREVYYSVTYESETFIIVKK